MWIGLGGALINLLFNYLLIPKFGVNGAAYSTVLSFSLIFLLSWQTSKKYYYIPFKWRQLDLVLLPLVFVFISICFKFKYACFIIAKRANVIDSFNVFYKKVL